MTLPIGPRHQNRIAPGAHLTSATVVSSPVGGYGFVPPGVHFPNPNDAAIQHPVLARKRGVSPHEIVRSWDPEYRLCFENAHWSFLPGRKDGAPRFGRESASFDERVQSWQEAYGGYKMLKETLGFSCSRYAALISRWPGEYQLALFQRLGKQSPEKISRDLAKGILESYNLKEHYFGGWTQFSAPGLKHRFAFLRFWNADGEDRTVTFPQLLQREIEVITQWIASFHLPLEQGSGWRRCGATPLDVECFKATFRPARRGTTDLMLDPVKARLYSKKEWQDCQVCIHNAVLEAAEAWAGRHSADGWIETQGYFVGEKKNGVLEITAFEPLPSINSDVWLGPAERKNDYTLTPRDQATPILLADILKEAARRGPRIRRFGINIPGIPVY